MAIQNYCTSCRSSFELSSKDCPSCESKLGQKYRVSVSVKGKRVNRVVEGLTVARETEAALLNELCNGAPNQGLLKGKKCVVMKRVTPRVSPNSSPSPTTTITTTESSTPTLNDVFATYLPYAQSNKKTWEDDMLYYRKHLEPVFGNRSLDTIKPLDIERFKISLSKSKNKLGRRYASATIKHQLVILRRLFNVARKWGIYSGPNPMDQVDMPKIDNQKNEFMTNDQMLRLMKVLDTWPCQDTVEFVKFALLTGLRRGELFKLRWKDIDFDHGGLVTLRKPKGGKTATIPISQTAQELLKNRLKKVVSRRSPYIFPGKDGRKQKVDFKTPWHRIRKAAGLPADFRFHGLRHHFASTLVSNGVDLAIVKELLTHKDIATTQRYAHLKQGVLKEAALRSDALLQPSRPCAGDDSKKVIRISRK